MKKHLLILFVAMFAAAWSLNAQTIVINEGFENGIQDSVWTQEFVYGNHPWAVEGVEDDPQWPTSIWQGSKRAYLRNTSGETQGYVTRLVSKVMDLTPAKIYQPELTFWYANPKWTADRDTLRVLYKTGHNAKWKQLAEYSSASMDWQKVRLELPELSETYQIAFEGTDNLGRGIVLDSIKLRSAPECTVPHDISINNKGNGLVNIAWNASWDANFFELIVSKEIISPDTVNLVPDSLGIIAYHGMVDGMRQNHDVELVSGENYYVYVRSVCELETSMWNSEVEGNYHFRVMATKNVPYYFGFNLPYKENVLSRDLEWTWRGNTGKFNPFINSHTKDSERYSYSKDSTSCVVFTGDNNLTTPLPADKYAYLATPALTDTTNVNFTLSQCQVRFVATVHKYTGRSYAHSIIVGVMTDPEDVTTFVPIDTVSVWGREKFEEFVVELSAYNGNANYVAFMSAFDNKNIIYIDDVAIEYKSATQVPTAIAVNPRDTWADITWKGAATTYNVLITNEAVIPSKVEASQIVAQVTVNKNQYKCEVLEADHSWNRPYYVYVQAVDGAQTSDWSFGYSFVTIASQKEVPFTKDFEGATDDGYQIEGSTTKYPTEIGIFTNDAGYPHIVGSNVYNGASALNLSKEWGNDSWITLPMVDSLSDKQVKFYLSGASTPGQTSATLGVMTNPMDISTFIPVSSFTAATTGYVPCYANFKNYTGPHGVIAIVWTDLHNRKKTINYIDDISVETISQCLPPTDVVADAEPNQVTVTWNSSQADTWEFILTNASLSSAQMDLEFDSIRQLDKVLYADTLTWNEPLKNPTFTFDSLEYKTSYYFYIRTLCGEEKTWWTQGTFTTPCMDNFPIPFFEDFESYSTGAYEDGFDCWKTINYATGSGYPKILNLTTGEPNGNMLELWSTSTTQRNLVMLPGLDMDISQVMLSFKTRSWSASAKSVLYVGSIGDIYDPSTFVPVDTFYNENGNLTEVHMDLADYTFAHDNIVFTSGLGDVLEMNSDVMVDDIGVRPNNCISAWNFELTDVQPHSLDIKWDGKTSDDEWTVKVMLDSVLVIPDSIVIGKTFRAEGLKSAKKYTFYVHPSCDTIWSKVSYYTACEKLDPTKPNKEDFESITDATTSYKATSQIPCWTTGNANPEASTSYLPFVYKGTSYASSGNNTYRAYGYYSSTSSSTSNPAYIASPEINCTDMKELAVTFNVYASTSYYWLCGVMTDPNDLSTFVVLDSVKGTGESMQYTYDLSETKYEDLIPDSARYFAWRGRYGKTDYLYLDDVSIIKITCPIPKPSISNLKSDSVLISSGLRTDNEWILLVADTAAFTADELAMLNVDSLVKDSLVATRVVYYDTIDVRSQKVLGLTEKKDYYVAVATVCDGGLSGWKTLSFTTPCKALTPEAMGTITFSSADGYVSGYGADRNMPCWTVGNKSGNASATSSYIPYVYTTEAYLFGPKKDSVLCVYSYVPTSATSTKYNGAYAIMPELNVDDITKYQVNFWARAHSTGTYGNKLIVCVGTDPMDLNTFVAIDTLTLNHSMYENFTVAFDDYQGDYMGNMGRYIMFTNECIDVTSNYSFVASISVEEIPSCRPVIKFVVDSISENAAMISWKQHSDSYRMMIAEELVEEEEKATYEWMIDSIVTETDSIWLTNLTPNKHYYVYAQAFCSEGESSAISTAYAHILTDCPVNYGFAAPYFVNFDTNSSTGTGKKPDCWDGVQLTYDTVGTTQTYPYVYTTASYAVEKNSMYMYSYFASASNTKTYAVAPKMAGNLNDYMISFYARNGGTTTSYGHILRVGYVTDATQKGIDSTFVKIADVYVEGAKQKQYQVLISDSIKEQIPAGARIALKADHSIQGLTGTSGYGSFYIDNFKIGFPPSCYPPVLEAGNTTLNTAEVIITPFEEGNTNWQLAIVPDSIYSEEGFKADEYLAGAEVRIVDADSTHFVVSNLQDGTKYWVYGRTICGGEDGNSAWSDVAISIRTKYYYKDSYFFGFEKNDGWDFCKNSTSTTYYIHPALEVGYEGGTATTSYTSYYPYSMQNTSTAVYAYGPADGSLGKGVIRWQVTTSYWGGYLVLPAVQEAHDRSFEFKVRSGYLSSGKPSTSYAAEFEIGTIDKGKGYETYEVLATATVKKLESSDVPSEENDWLFENYSIEVDSATVATKQMVIRLLKPLDSSTRYVHFDNVALGAPKGFGMVSIKKVHAESKKATVIWSNTGGPWNLYILKENGDTLAQYKNLTGVTSQEITGLTPQTTYKAILESAAAPKDTKYMMIDDKCEFTTLCMPIEPNAKGEFVWDFNDPSEWEQSDVIVGKGEVTDSAYFKPSCFTTGTTYTGTLTTSNVYYNWLIQRKGYGYTGAPTTKGTTATSTARYEYGRNDSPALRVYTSSSYMTPYIALPELNCSFDTMMIEFYGRCFANYDDTYGTEASQNKMVSASYLGATYSQSMVVGTLTDPYDFSTLEVIDTVEYTAYRSTTAGYVTDDPTGNRYWQQMRLPLATAKGKYLVLFQPSHGLFFLDDLKVKAAGDNLFSPSRLVVTDVTTNTASFAWDAKHPTLQTVIVVEVADEGNEVLRDTLPGTQMEYTVTGLTHSTAYTWYVYQTNGKLETQKAGNKRFYTECGLITPDYTTGFELSDGWCILPAQTSETYKQTVCWTYENAGTAAVGTNAYNLVNGTSLYSHSGDYAAKIYATSTTQQNYIAMPAIEDVAAYDTLQVNFWMRPTYVTKSTMKPYASYLGESYSQAVIVGTMSDPMDPSTFVPIDTINYTYPEPTSQLASEYNEFLYQPKKVALEGAKGKHVAFMATLYAKGSDKKCTYCYMYLDDISFSLVQRCNTPEELNTDDITSSTARLSWDAQEGATAYVLQVSSDYTYTKDTAFVFNDTITDNFAIVKGMESYTEYVWRVRTICNEELGESEFSANTLFTTAREPFFSETFISSSLDLDWGYGTTPIEKVLDSVGVEITGANSSSYGWKRVTTDYGIEGAHYAVPFYSSTNDTTTTYDHYWLIMPILSLSESDSTHMTFDMAMTGSNTTTPNANGVTEANMADDYTFMIVISDDGGKTWKKENIVAMWNNMLPAGQQLRDIPSTATEMRINLEKYAGKNIRVAFYREAETYKSATCALHIDNIRVNYFDVIKEDAQACQYEDINQLGFTINGDVAEAGTQVLSRIKKASSSDASIKNYHDSIYVLHVDYIPVVETIIVDTICEGESYTSVDFNGKSRPGVYRHKMQSALSCDSIVTLLLSVTPTLRAEDQIIALCPGETYTWNSKEYNRAGIYRDTTLSSLGCDSIQTLVLSFNEAEDTIYAASEVDITELPFTYESMDYPYAAGQAPIFYPTGTAKGVYNDTVLVQGVNCVAVLVHTLTVTDRHEGIEDVMNELGAGARKVLYRDNLYIICNDDWYTATGQKVNDPRK